MIGKIKYQLRRSSKMKRGYLISLSVLILFLIVGGFSFAIFTSRSESRGALNIVTGNLYPYIESVDLDKDQSLIVNPGGEKEITITLKNVNAVDAKFNLWYESVDGVSVSYDSSSDKPPLKEGEVVRTEESRTYKLKVVNTTDIPQKIIFGSEAGLYNKPLDFKAGKKVIESIIVRTKMTENMIKVVYDETQKTWIKADSNNWYNYDFGKWANAVTVSSTTRETYSNASVGTPVNMDDIETMWVWIPRYSYTIGSEDGEHYYGKQGTYLDTTPTQELPGEIDIKFIGKNEKDTGSAQYKVTEGVSNWRTPDAFTLGVQELSGIWVGKFETSSSNPGAEDGGGNTTDLDSMIKPNVSSWRRIQIASIGEVGRKASATNNRYGFDNTIDSHAMKNSEWAAVAYLSQSKYGKLGNREFSGMEKEVYQNKATYITGCSAGTPSSGTADLGCQYTYDIPLLGTGASTTGNIYGIYDMSGGCWEYVMGIYAPNGIKYSGNTLSENSGYNGLLKDGNIMTTGKEFLADQYYNFYESNGTSTTCNNKECISHGFSEIAGWYKDNATPVGTADSLWVVRGGGAYSETWAGVFNYSADSGDRKVDYSFRLVLTTN